MPTVRRITRSVNVVNYSLPVERLHNPRELVDASGGDPLVRHLLPHVLADGPLLADAATVLFAYDYWDGTGIQLVGDPVRSAALLRAAGALPSDYVAVPEDGVDLLDALFTPDSPWRFRWTSTPPPPPAYDGRWLDAGEHDEVEALLASSFPDASARPGNRHAQRWAGIRDKSGTLIAAAADCTETDVGFMASVVSDVRLRRTGVGLAMTAWMTHALLDEFGIAALWQYSSNTTATALYDKLGFRDDHRYVAGVLAPAS
ncbi:MAG: GNAT family N-acetyltransferase [Mycobacteriales bacterium]